MRVCNYCGYIEHSDWEDTCPACGGALSIPVTCSSCGADILDFDAESLGIKLCSACRAEVRERFKDFMRGMSVDERTYLDELLDGCSVEEFVD